MRAVTAAVTTSSTGKLVFGSFTTLSADLSLRSGQLSDQVGCIMNSKHTTVQAQLTYPLVLRPAVSQPG